MTEKYPPKPDAKADDRPAVDEPAADDGAAGGEPAPPVLDADDRQALVRKLQRKYGL